MHFLSRFGRSFSAPAIRPALALLLSLAGAGLGQSATGVEPEFAESRHEHPLLAAADLAGPDEMAYLAFPALLRTTPDEILISYKRGRRHASDPGALLEVIRFDVNSDLIQQRQVVAEDPELVYQMGEWVRFPNGMIGNFVDVQHVVQGKTPKRNQRTGIQWTRSDDQGRTFTPMRPLGVIDGVEYGYLFEGVSTEHAMYALVMTFPELPPQTGFVDEQGRRAYGQVCVIASADNGETWRFVKNLSQEFGGLKLNESSILALDDGFLIATRGYDSQLRLHRVDADFNLLQQLSLTDQTLEMESHIGRPRLYRRDEAVYLLGRNHRDGRMELANFRLDPKTYEVDRMVVLDPPRSSEAVKDGYYAAPYFAEQKSGTKFNVITYRRFGSAANPDLIRLEFDWNEVR
ncbi:MAG: sialidase family protein [Novipirellula sp. JB048]